MFGRQDKAHYQVRFSEDLVLVSPLLEADGDGLAASHGRAVRGPPDLDDGHVPADLEVGLDDVTNLGLGHRRVLLNPGIGLDAVEHLKGG